MDAKLSSGFTNQVTGPTPVGPTVTHDNTNKYWELTGEITSNLSVEANTFLEGDQPHAVSVWFNSSNLEANVSNTCVFSVASEEKLDSVNLDLQSNTWHNLTYAYQGEGGSRVTYLDGRKVAKDQAEDTFGDYPPFAMTGYSQGGYVVSVSSTLTTTDYFGWYAFNSDTTTPATGWVSADPVYTGGSYTSAVTRNLGTDSGGAATVNGEYITLEMPHRLRVNYVKITHRNANTNRSPASGRFYGSNDGITWEEMKQFSGITELDYANGPVTISINSNKSYKRVALVPTGIPKTTADWVGIGNLEYYGHRENDLVRLPDPTNVLKYPHIIINEPAKRGYVVSQSSQQVPPSTTGSYQAFNIFDGNLVFSGGSGAAHSRGGAWITAGMYDSSGNPTGSGVASTDVTGQSPVATPGEWVQLELPHKVKLSSIRVMGNTENATRLAQRSPVDAVLAGSNNGTTWTTVLTYTGASWTTLNEFKSFPANIDSTNAYKYFRFIITKNSGADASAALQEFEFYGTGVDSIPIQIGGGNINKVANFRVYNKFIEEDQALEIWDAQKDEFGRAKSSMTLQKGRLGLGTEEPEGRLAVLDEPHNLEEFPPRAMTSSETYIEGHGVFRASSSSEYSSTYTAFDAFDKITYNDAGVADNAWLSAHDSLYASASDYAFTGSTTLGNGTVAGEWLKLELPYKIVLKSITLSPRPSSTTHLNQAPEDFKIYGSNDDINWIEVLSETGAAPSLWTGTDFITDTSTTSYRYFAIVVQKTVGYDGFTAISGLKYFGTREQGQSVLHDGQLTLTKNLAVPRIGPPLDADDTPRRDKLVVDTIPRRTQPLRGL